MVRQYWTVEFLLFSRHRPSWALAVAGKNKAWRATRKGYIYNTMCTHIGPIIHHPVRSPRLSSLIRLAYFVLLSSPGIEFIQGEAEDEDIQREL